MVLRDAVRVVQVELIAVAVALAQRELQRVVLGAPDGALRGECGELRVEVRVRPVDGACRITEQIGAEQRRRVIRVVVGEVVGHGLRGRHPAPGRIGEQVLEVRNRRDAHRVEAVVLELRDELSGGGVVVGARLGVHQVERHEQVAPHQQVPPQPADIRRLDADVLRQLVAEHGVEGMRVGRGERIVDGRVDVRAIGRCLRESSRRRRRYRRRQHVDALESHRGVVFVGPAVRARQARG